MKTFFRIFFNGLDFMIQHNQYLFIILICFFLQACANVHTHLKSGEPHGFPEDFVGCRLNGEECTQKFGDFTFTYQVLSNGSNNYQLAGNVVYTGAKIYERGYPIQVTFVTVKGDLVDSKHTTWIGGSLTAPMSLEANFTTNDQPEFLVISAYSGTISE